MASASQGEQTVEELIQDIERLKKEAAELLEKAHQGTSNGRDRRKSAGLPAD